MWWEFIILITFCGELALGEDVEIDANIRIDPNFVKNIKQSLDEELELFRFKSENPDGVDPIMENIKGYGENEPERPVMRPLQDNLEIIKTYEKRSLQKGVDSIESIAAYLEHTLKVTHAGLTPIIKKIKSNYNSQIYEYFFDLTRTEPESDVDKEYIILDMVNVVSLITRRVQSKLLDKTLALSSNTADNEKEILTGTLLTFNDFDKRQEVQFVCEHFLVCRPNPAFSGYVFKLLEEILELNVDKFQYCIIRSAKMLMKNQSFFETLLGKTIIKWFKSKIDNIAMTEVAELKQAVLSLHSVILRRYNIENLNTMEIQPNTRSKAILADILDVAFGLDGDALYGDQINRLITEIKDWGLEIVTNVDIKLDDTIKYIIEALETNLTPRGKKEIMVLADIIFYNRSEDQIAVEYFYLMTKGSKFVKGLVHQEDTRKLW